MAVTVAVATTTTPPMIRTANRQLAPRSLQTNPTGIPNGIWTSRGYGNALNITGNTILAFEETAISCIENVGVVEAISETEFLPGNETIVISADGALSKFFFDKSEGFQFGCANGTTPVLGDPSYERSPLESYDILTTTFAEHYAFFEQRNLSWDVMTAEARSSLSDNSTDEELFDAFTSILDPLNDGHVQIIIPDQEFYSSKPFEIVARLQEEFLEQEDFDDYEEFQNALLGAWIGTVFGFMEEGLQGDFDSILYGKFADANVGYMMMQGFSTDDEPSFLQVLEDAFAALKSTDTIVFDIRVNGGGTDEIALLVASYFASETTKAFTKKAWDRNSDDGFTATTEVFIEPTQEQNAYGGNVVLIVSGSTVSAAEIFTISMAQLNQTTILGRNTSGEFSDILGRTLPNGWLFGLSNEVYADPDGTVYEIVGIPPDILPEAELLPLSELQSGQDSWLEVALAAALASAPTSQSSDSPSGTPVSAQTAAPTVSPVSGAPASAPTQSPMNNSADSPSGVPVAAPTVSPSLRPPSGVSNSMAPTGAPTSGAGGVTVSASNFSGLVSVAAVILLLL